VFPIPGPTGSNVTGDAAGVEGGVTVSRHPHASITTGTIHRHVLFISPPFRQA